MSKAKFSLFGRKMLYGRFRKMSGSTEYRQEISLATPIGYSGMKLVYL